MPKSRKRLARPKKPTLIGPVLLATSASRTDEKKVNITGIINVFVAWAFPCFRPATVVISLFQVQKGLHRLRLACRREGTPKPIVEMKTTFTVEEPDAILALNFPLQFRFEAEGLYELFLEINTATAPARVPFAVQTKTWPELRARDKSFLKEHPEAATWVRATVECPKCGTPFMFRESVPPHALVADDPVHAFPPSGTFPCTTCNTSIPLRDIQGQLRETLLKKIEHYRKSER